VSYTPNVEQMFPWYENTEAPRILSLDADAIAVAILILQLKLPKNVDIERHFGPYESQVILMNKVFSEHGNCFDPDERLFLFAIIKGTTNTGNRLRFLRLLARKAMTTLQINLTQVTRVGQKEKWRWVDNTKFNQNYVWDICACKTIEGAL
jgi:hypothetical protein